VEIELPILDYYANVTWSRKGERGGGKFCEFGEEKVGNIARVKRLNS